MLNVVTVLICPESHAHELRLLQDFGVHVPALLLLLLERHLELSELLASALLEATNRLESQCN